MEFEETFLSALRVALAVGLLLVLFSGWWAEGVARGFSFLVCLWLFKNLLGISLLVSRRVANLFKR